MEKFPFRISLPEERLAVTINKMTAVTADVDCHLGAAFRPAGEQSQYAQ
jgi:hypothetical protein